MSLDLYLYAKRETNIFSRNITHNLTTMADAAGLYDVLWRPDEHGLESAEDAIPVLEQGVAALRADPDKFRSMNPENGWGNYEYLLEFSEDVLAACKENPDARLVASR